MTPTDGRSCPSGLLPGEAARETRSRRFNEEKEKKGDQESPERPSSLVSSLVLFLDPLGGVAYQEEPSGGSGGLMSCFLSVATTLPYTDPLLGSVLRSGFCPGRSTGLPLRGPDDERDNGAYQHDPRDDAEGARVALSCVVHNRDQLWA
jgi:hypothetical protein